MKKLAIFDFDGTLFDSIWDVISCFNRALTIYGFPTLTREEYIPCLGGDIDDITSRVLGENNTPENLEKVKKTYLDFYNPSKKELTVPFDNALEILEKLQENGILLAINSNRLNYSLNEVVEKYNKDGLADTGATNAVAGMILDYRAFDTLGESHVLFVATVCVMILLRLELNKDGKPTDRKRAEEENDRLYEPKNDKILQLSAKIMVPVIILYGIYVILNGHLSPGGGFSGGAIVGAGLILYVNAFGFERASRIMNRKNYAIISVVPLLFYALAKGYSFFTGANHLPSGIPKGTPGAILSGGLILPLNICVGLVVACTMYHFYTLFRKGGM